MDWFDMLQLPLYDLNTEIISSFSDFNNEKPHFYDLNNIIVEEVLIEGEEIPQFSASACVNQIDLKLNDEDIGLAADNHMNMEDLQGDDDSRAYFLCPFCYVEIELRVLCSHLQEEHCFGLNNAVCPLCAANLGKDALGHFTMQHSHSVKRKRKSRKSGVWGNCPTIIGKDFQEMSCFFGSSLISRRNNVQDPAPDPLLSPFLSNMPLLDPKADLEDKSSSTTTSLDHNVTSDGPTILNEFSEQDYEERGRRAAFAQELILSAIF